MFYIVELCRLMYWRLLYLMYVFEIKLHVLKPILFKVKSSLDYITQICEVQDFSMEHIAPTIYVVHDA